jgi:hypothetical protein
MRLTGLSAVLNGTIVGWYRRLLTFSTTPPFDYAIRPIAKHLEPFYRKTTHPRQWKIGLIQNLVVPVHDPELF